ncbi:MAG TPA: diacylglycerol kinase family protein [Pyrinomonadaceae bacterium]|nr:diacylglycerol kinase family protein [Pyrinomonadaceae bacterium]
MLIIINKVAAKALQSWPKIKHKLDAAGVDYKTSETQRKGDATLQARVALNAGVQLIVVVGGDGTLSEAAEGFFQFHDDLDVLPTPINPSATLAILPAGTGDDFARGLRRKRAPLNEWIDLLLSFAHGDATARPIDVLYGRCDDFQKPFICLNASTMGIGGETAGRVAAQGALMRRFSGEFRFVFAAVGALAAWRERRVRVTVDKRVVADGPMNLVGVANGLYAGGGMMLSTEARLDDGKLDVVTASGLTRANVVTELSRIHTGGHLKNPKVTLTQGTQVRIETLLLQDAMPLEADGNVRGVTPVEFRVLPRALRFLATDEHGSGF